MAEPGREGDPMSSIKETAVASQDHGQTGLVPAPLPANVIEMRNITKSYEMGTAIWQPPGSKIISKPANVIYWQTKPKPEIILFTLWLLNAILAVVITPIGRGRIHPQ